MPNLAQWTGRAGEDQADLAEIYSETLGIWSLYMGHVAALVGGVEVDLKTSDQTGAVYRPVPAERQRAAVAFLGREVFVTPSWLAPSSILSRIGPQTGGAALATRQANVVVSLLDPRRLARIEGAAALGREASYSLVQYFSDLHAAIWQGGEPDDERRLLQRVYLERLEALMRPPAASPSTAAGGGGQPPSALLVTPNVSRSDVPSLAGSQLRSIRENARRLASQPGSRGIVRAHYQDIVRRIDVILDPSRGGS